MTRPRSARIVRGNEDMTPEEIAASTWMELGDDLLAGIVRGVAEKYSCEPWHAVGLAAHVAIALGVAAELNATAVRYEVDGFTLEGRPMGDWELIVRRRDRDVAQEER